MPDILDRLQAFVDAERRVAATGIIIPDTSIIIPDSIPKPPTPGTYTVRGFTHEYSTIDSWNCEHTALILNKPGGEVYLFRGDGSGGWKLPAPIVHGSQCRWSTTDPNGFYYLHLNELRYFNTGADWSNPSASALIRKFREYPNINGMGEADISADGDNFVLCSGQNVFLYSIPEDRKVIEFTAPWAFNNLYCTPENNVLLSTESGVYLRTPTNGTLRKVAYKMGHMDVCSYAGEEHLIYSNSAEAPVNPEGCTNGVVRIRLRDGERQCLLSLDWSMAMHISCGAASFALVSAFQPTAAGLARILKVPIDGSRAEVLEEWTGAFDKYELQPKASVSHDGSRFVYTRGNDAVVV